MNHKKYVERQIELAQELNDVANTSPYDVDRYDAIVREAEALYDSHYRKLTRRRHPRLIFWLVALLFIAFIIYTVIRDLLFAWYSCGF